MSNYDDVIERLYRYPGVKGRVCSHLFDLTALVALLPVEELNHIIDGLGDTREHYNLDELDRKFYGYLRVALQCYVADIFAEEDEYESNAARQ